ncbi:MAG: glycogen debranching N-terminal domain-containing protein [Chloroflexota bacterium]
MAQHGGSRLLPHGEPIALADIRDALLIKEGALFLMSDAEGNLPRDSVAGYGLYKGDTRYLSVFDLSFDGVRPTVLLSTAELGYASEQHLTNPPMMTHEGKTVPKDSIEIRRQRVIGDHLLESLQLTNFNPSRLTVNLRFEFDADFLDIFEVRGEKRDRRGRLLAPAVKSDTVAFSYRGLDRVYRRTDIRFSPRPAQLWYNGALFTVCLAHRETATITVVVAPDTNRLDGRFTREFHRQTVSYQQWLDSCTEVFTSNEFVNAILDRSLNDIRLLMTNSGDGTFVAAGTPWFNCLFGRDTLITSLQSLAFQPGIARNTLRLLARWQGKEEDDWKDEEPGKILHELRSGEMASLGEIPMIPYYGSVDSTPLFLMLAAEYYAWTGDLELMRELEANLNAALTWIDTYGNVDGCGYVQYRKRSAKGLVNQGWKDSRNGIINSDGTLVRPPITLVEVQGYVYAAKVGMAGVYSALGHRKMAGKLLEEATTLKERFNHDFWLEDEGFYALALGGDGEPARSISSNPGQCLWTGIVSEEHAPKVVEHLFSNEMFSGWGIRTLSSQGARYNPLSYHLGSVWPHDNAIIGMGLKRYGFEDELNELATALYDCCRSFDYYRLPELFCGVPRSAHSVPVRYPVACRPQAWAAGAFPMLMHAILGLTPEARRSHLTILRPRLPYWLEQVEVRKLKVGEGRAGLVFERQGQKTRVSVTERQGITITTVRK